MSRFSRTDKSLLSEWWWTIDRWLLAVSVLLVLAGILLSLAASPAIAQKLGLSNFHFVTRHIFYAVLALGVLFATSLASIRQARRIALVVAGIGFLLLIVSVFSGETVKGASRWVYVLGFSLQPSELVKPAFVVLCAWLFAENGKRNDMPGNALALAIFAGFAALLVLQPDFGQTILISLVWGTMLFLTGLPWVWIASLGVAGMTGLSIAYMTVPHVSARVDRFFYPDGGDTYQVDIALQAITRGGWFGVGPGEGTIKRVLPDAHSDFVFAVAGEEFGIIACLILVALYGFIVIRVLGRAMNETDPFIRLVTTGLVALFGFQAIINMAVSLQLVPAKGMTLPLVSYGGSSLVSVCFAIGLLLVFTRRRPGDRISRAYWGQKPQPEPAG